MWIGLKGMNIRKTCMLHLPFLSIIIRERNLSFEILDTLGRRNLNTLPLPNRTIPLAQGQDLDFINVAHSHLIHTDWDKLNNMTSGLTPFRINHILLKVQKDHVLSQEFFNWIELQKPNSHILETLSIMLHILTKAKQFRAAESFLKKTLLPKTSESALKLFESLLYSYRMCDSSPHVFDSLFKTYAHMNKFRNATYTFCQMKNYGFLPTIESCNAYMSSLLGLRRMDIALAFYREICRCHISPNVYTFNMVISAYCKSGKLEKAERILRNMENVGCSPTVVSFNALIDGNCKQGLMGSAIKLKNVMIKSGLNANIVTYNTLINGFCKEGNLTEANRIFIEMKSMDVAPNTVTYNTLILGFSQLCMNDMGFRLYDEMVKNGVQVDILTYNALILCLCKEGKTKKAAHLVKQLDREGLTPNASTFSALIVGQCNRKNSERAFQLYKSMVRSGFNPSSDVFEILMSTFCKNEDYDGAVQILGEMLERSVKPDKNILKEIFKGLNRKGKKQDAQRLYADLERKHLISSVAKDCEFPYKLQEFIELE